MTQHQQTTTTIKIPSHKELQRNSNNSNKYTTYIVYIL